MSKVKRPDGYFVWQAMIRRCECPSATGYHLYGGRGITVCKQWRHDFNQFMRDMGARPAGYSVERKDTNGHYTPGNCVWATMKRQQNNRRNNRRITYSGRTMTMTQWAEELGISVQSLYGRMKRGMTPAQAIEYRFPLLTHDGKSLNAVEWSKILGIKSGTISKRISQGWSVERALTTPTRPLAVRDMPQG